MPPHGRRRAAGSNLSLLSLLLLAFALVTPTLAASSVLGIDLGTEYIKAALIKPGIPLEIVLTKDSRRKEQAAIAFKPATGKQLASSAQQLFPERAYGADASALSARFPSDVYANLKPLLGLSSHASEGKESPIIAGYQERYPGLALQQCSATRDTVCLRSATFADAEEPFSVEELLAMQLQNVRKNAESMAGNGNLVRDAVITVPPYWSANEKRAVETAAELAGLRVLSLTTDGLAVGLNYATTREFPVVTNGAKPEYHLVFDMGAGSATATVMRFQGRSVKDVGKFNKTVQEIQVMGAGWDATLGGDALNQVILDDLVAQLAASKPMKALGAGVDDIHKHGRTMAKLWKETERLRQILSANTDTQANLEGLYNGEVTFKYKISRAQFEKLAAGYETRVTDTVLQALEMAKLDLKDLDSVILHGGATRTPLVQKALEGVVKTADQLKNNVNSDEAAAFGAAFRAAGISPSFRVKDIRSTEAAILPVEMTWTVAGKDRTQKLFVGNSPVGQEKYVPFKTVEDFTLTLTQLAKGNGPEPRPVLVSKVATTNLTAAAKELREKYGCEPERIDTQLVIRLNPDTGLPEVTRGTVSCEVTEEKKPAGVVEGVKNLFGFGSKEAQTPLKEAETEAEAEAETASLDDGAETTTSEKPAATDKANPKKGANEKDDPAPVTTEIKIRTVYVGVAASEIGLPRVQGAELKAIRDRMKAFDTSDKQRLKREAALNDLESYTYRLRDLVEETGFAAASTDALRAQIAETARAAGDWIYGDGADAPLAEFQRRLKDLQALVTPVEARAKEASQRDLEVAVFRDVLNQTKAMFDSVVRENADRKAAADAAAASPAASPADELDDLDDASAEPSVESDGSLRFELPTFSDEQIADLEKAYATAKNWLEEKLAAQGKLAATADPAFTVAELKKKAAELQQTSVDMLTKQMDKKKKAEKAKSSSKKKKAKKTATEEAGSATEAPAEETPKAKDEKDEL